MSSYESSGIFHGINSARVFVPGVSMLQLGRIYGRKMSQNIPCQKNITDGQTSKTMQKIRAANVSHHIVEITFLW